MSGGGHMFDFPMARERGRRSPGRGRSGPATLGAAMGDGRSLEEMIGALNRMRSTAPPAAQPVSDSRPPAGACPTCRAGVVIRPDNNTETLVAERCPVHTACSCDGRGFVFEQDANGYSVTKPCACRRCDGVIRRINAAGLPARHAGDWETIDRLATQAGGDGQASRAAIRPLRQWARTFDPRRPGLRGHALVGPVGTLKTGIATAAAVEVAFTGRRVRFVEIKQAWARSKALGDDQGAAARAALIADIVAVDLVVLDDIDGARTPAHRAWVDELVDRLYRARTTVIITANRRLRPKAGGDQREEYLDDVLGARAASRLAEMCDERLLLGGDVRRRFDRGLR